MRWAFQLVALLCFAAAAPVPAAAIDFKTTKNETIRPSGHVSSLPPSQHIRDVSFRCSTSPTGECRVHDFIRATKICALLVIKDGKVRLQDFGENIATCGNDEGEPPSEVASEDRLLGLASVTKSLVSVLTGQAIALSTGARTRGDFERAVERPIGELVPELRDSAYADVPLKDVMSMRSGVRWREGFLPFFPNDADDFKAKVRDRPRSESILHFAQHFQTKRAQPGKWFDYMALDPNVAGLALTRMLGKKVRLPDFVRHGLWPGIGARSTASWGIDMVGAGIADCCTRMTAEDLGRVGLLVLRKGRGPWGRQLIPRAWFDVSLNGFQKIPAGLRDQNPGCPMRYGYFWWQREKRTDFSGIGTNGQFLHIYPKENAVVVQISDWRRWRNDWECDSFWLHDALVALAEAEAD